jgi:hypothetical protein
VQLKGSISAFLPILVFSLLVLWPAAVLQGADFRGFDWFASLPDIRASETARFVRHVSTVDRNNLVYETTVLEEPVTLVYLFDTDCGELIQARYDFKEMLALSRFSDLLKLLGDKYGPPASGKLEVYTWQAPRTTVELVRESLLPGNAGNTTVTYTTAAYNWSTGWKQGAAPECGQKKRLLEEEREQEASEEREL